MSPQHERAHSPSNATAESASNPDNWIAELLPDPQQNFQEFADRIYEGDALSRKTKELIAVAAASVDRCPHCTNSHIEAAQEKGASDAEIAEALAVASGQGGGTQVFWMKEDFADLLGENWRSEFLPDADRAFWNFKAPIFESDTLPRRTKELIAVAVSTMLRCRHCTRSHIEKAFDEDASTAAVAEALGVAWVIGSGSEVAWNR